MDEEYDAIVLGTGLTECILSGLLSCDGKKVLHMDRNGYYGGDAASVTLTQLYDKFKGGAKPPEALGHNRDWNIDLIPKFIMGAGNMVDVLIHTDVTKYLEFKAVDGSFVLRNNKVCKVPCTPKEAMLSPLMGLFEKRRAMGFFKFVNDYDDDDARTHKGMDLARMTMKDLYTYYNLEPATIEFIGHALALKREDSYINEPALPTVKAIQLYHESLARFDTGSPYLYPLYGLGELPQAFARLSAVYGGTYMLNKPDAEIVYDEAGKAVGVKSEGETARAKVVVCDNHYAQQKVKKVGRVVRCICITSHPIPNTNDGHSVQIIIPQSQTGRKTDIYVFCSSFAHQVAARGKYIAFVSTAVETDRPESEVSAGLALLGGVDEKFFDVQDVYEPVADGTGDGVFISKSYDETSHFETTMDDVFDMYRRITGKELVLNTSGDQQQQQ